MTVHISECHRRMAELVLKVTNHPSKNMTLALTNDELNHLLEALVANKDLVYKIDSLKNMAYMAHVLQDSAWEQDICLQLDEIEWKAERVQLAWL